MDAKRPSLDPREAPPPGLKEIYKKYQKLKFEDLELDSEVLDFSKGHVGVDVDLLESIESSRLEFIFSHFLGEEELCDQRISLVYRHKRLPGLLILPALLPIKVQGELLSRLMHRDFPDPRHRTNLHLHYDIPYPVGPEEQPSASEAQSSISDRTSFFSYSPVSEVMFMPKDLAIHRPLSISKVLQKSLRWITLGGQYDWTNKVYPDERPPAFPSDIAGLVNGLFPDMMPQSAIVNLYSPGDTLSLHRDVSEQSDRGLASISIGCDCLFVIGNHNSSDGLVIRLRSGDGVYMTKDARFAWHGVPRILPKTCPSALKSWPAESSRFEAWRGWMSDKRINLNVRQMRD